MKFERLVKIGQLISQNDNAQQTGQYISSIILFIMNRIPSEDRSKQMMNLKNKIKNLSVPEIASKNPPPTSSLGQSLTFLKTILMGHDPAYIKAVLNNVLNNLG